IGEVEVAPPGAEPSVNPNETDRQSEFKSADDRQKYEETKILIEKEKLIQKQISEKNKLEKEQLNKKYSKLYKRKKSTEPVIENSNSPSNYGKKAGE
ncbi:MAG: hypothetical protein LH629_10595, partial [Ignavibacteria bacterium]|nr:hypothetical protein [Ignavibacteria bacterium]